MQFASDSFDAPSVYSNELQRFGGQWLGHALWYPTPSAGEEVEIGDVGYVSEGRFRRLFNVTSQAGFNRDLRPEGFKPLEYETGLEDRRILNVTPMVSESVTVVDAGMAAYV